jgi:hypothetical protein
MDANHDEKVVILSQFLNRKPGLGLHVMILIDEDIILNTRPLDDAIDKYNTSEYLKVHNDDDNWNISIWKAGHVPYYTRFIYNGAPTKWIVIRPNMDAMAQCLMDEWNSNGLVEVIDFKSIQK